MPIPIKKCYCGNLVKTFASIPRCLECTRSLCCLSFFPDSINRLTCNCIVDLVQREDKLFCVGHYKKIQQYCLVCGDPRFNDNTLAYDDFFYCKKHFPSIKFRNSYVIWCLKPFLINDVIKIIINLI